MAHVIAPSTRERFWLILLVLLIGTPVVFADEVTLTNGDTTTASSMTSSHWFTTLNTCQTWPSGATAA
jgi:hypothetical protein